LSNNDKDENENQELIPTSLMTGKSFEGEAEKEGDFSFGVGGGYAPIGYHVNNIANLNNLLNNNLTK